MPNPRRPKNKTKVDIEHIDEQIAAVEAEINALKEEIAEAEKETEYTTKSLQVPMKSRHLGASAIKKLVSTSGPSPQKRTYTKSG